MSLNLVLAIIALVLAVIAGIIDRNSTTMILVTVAVVLLAIIHVLGGGLVVR